jgi:hypothetical protein
VIELAPDTVLIGVDAGASEVKVHQVLLLSRGAPPLFGLGSASASCCWDRVPGFRPLPLAEQLAAQAAPALDEAEREQGRVWIEAMAGSILSVAHQVRRERALVGVGAPGLKTPDGRGIALSRNGPRIPELVPRLEQRLALGGLELARPIGALTSDGDDCGRGEEVDRQGLFRGVQNAYYVGGGTGLAEALKLRGRIVPFDQARRWIPKAWELPSRTGRNFEEALSTRGMNATWAADARKPLPIDPAEYPEERALRGDAIADGVLKESAHALVELVLERLIALRHGRGEGLEARHPWIGTLLDRIVIGQRLGRIYGEAHLARVLKERFEDELAHRLREAPFPRMRARYLDEKGRLRQGLVRASHLRAAPALGAAAAALGALVEGLERARA